MQNIYFSRVPNGGCHKTSPTLQDPRVYVSRGDANTLLGQGRDALDNYIRAVNLSPMTPEVSSVRHPRFNVALWRLFLICRSYAAMARRAHGARADFGVGKECEIQTIRLCSTSLPASRACHRWVAGANKCPSHGLFGLFSWNCGPSTHAHTRGAPDRSWPLEALPIFQPHRKADVFCG